MIGFLLAGLLPWEAATLRWQVDGDTVVAYFKGEVASAFWGHGRYQALIIGRRGWVADLEVGEFTEGEKHMGHPLRFLSLWALRDPLAETQIMELDRRWMAKGEEKLLGLSCRVWELETEDTSWVGRVWTLGDLALKYLWQTPTERREAILISVDTTSPIPPEALRFPPGLEEHR